MVEKIIFEMIKYFGNDAKRINHALKVFGFADAIMADLQLDSKAKDVVNFTAILHDIGIKESEKKYNSTAGKYQELEGPPVARSILEKLRVDNTIIERVCFIIGNHHSYEKIDGPDFQIIIEADFLVNAFEDSTNRNAIINFSNKYFQTHTGKEILKSIYL